MDNRLNNGPNRLRQFPSFCGSGKWPVCLVQTSWGWRLPNCCYLTPSYGHLTMNRPPALVWFVLSHPWHKYFTSDPFFCSSERFLPEEHDVVLYPTNITNYCSNDWNDLCGYKWLSLVYLLSSYVVYMQLFSLSLLFQSKHLYKPRSTTWIL